MNEHFCNIGKILKESTPYEKNPLVEVLTALLVVVLALKLSVFLKCLGKKSCLLGLASKRLLDHE